MPYITQEQRNDLLMEYHAAKTPSELNFLISHIISNYLDLKDVNYTTINDILGALEGAKLEFYRRVAVPYEDIKIKANGDVHYAIKN